MSEIVGTARAVDAVAEAVSGGAPAAPGSQHPAGAAPSGTAAEEPRDREVVLRNGYDRRLNTPLQINAGEVRRFNELWGRYDRGDELTPEERGELYEYLRRRMVIPYRNFGEALQSGDFDRIREAAREFARRYGQLERFVEGELPVSGREALEPYREQAARALRLSAAEASGMVPELPSNTLYNAGARQAAELMRARADLMGVSASADDYRTIIPRYAELERRLASARGTLAELRERGGPVPPELEREVRLAERWLQSARDTSDVLRARAGAINVSGGRRNGFTVGRRAVTLPEPPQGEALASPEMREAASRILFTVPRRGRTADLTRNLRALGIPYSATPAPMPDTAVHINWGSAGPFGEGVANRDTSGTVDKAEMLRRLGDLAPRSTFDVREAERLFGGRVVAKRRTGARGEGKEVIDLGTEEGRRKAYTYDFFQEFIPERDEYRVTLFGDEVLTAYRKNAAPGSGPEDLSPEREYERVRRLPLEAVEAAREARRRCGVDLAGVDLVRDRRDGRWYVLEVNAAPGMGRDTLARLVQVVAARHSNQNQV